VKFLLDTNTVSEGITPRPNAGLVDWFAAVDEDRVFVSVVTLAEIRHGIERMAAGARRARLDTWLQEELPARFMGRVIPVDSRVADTWGRLVARGDEICRPIAVMDAFIAATAEVHGLTLVTRNVSDFEAVIEAILNPWT
jgi:predicted nucleic acid-binding protein